MRGASLGRRSPPARLVSPLSPPRVYTRLMASRGSLYLVFSTGDPSILTHLLGPRKVPLDAAHEIQQRRRKSERLFITPIERVPQVSIDGKPACQVVIHVNAEIGVTGIFEQSRRRPKVGLDVQRTPAKIAGHVR